MDVDHNFNQNHLSHPDFGDPNDGITWDALLALAGTGGGSASSLNAPPSCATNYPANSEAYLQCDCYTNNICPQVLYYYHSDHLGSSTYITTSGGNEYQFLQYLPYGGIFVEQKDAGLSVPYLFNAKEYDEESGFYNFDTRYYNPDIVGFLSVDKASDMFPSHSPYNYAHNNPVRYRDYLGMGPDDWFEDDKGKIHYDASITSQAEFDASGIEGTYLGKQGYGIDPNSGERISYNIDGSQTRSSNGLGEVTITASRGGYGKDIVSNAPNALEGASKGLLPYSSKGMILGEAMDLGLSGQLTTNKVNSLSNLHSLSKYSKGLGRLGTIGTFAGGIYDIGSNGYYERGFGTYTQQATGRFAGGWAGAWAGAKLGAAGGAIFGGWGAIPGGIIGGLLGGYGGSKLGESGVKYGQKIIKQRL